MQLYNRQEVFELTGVPVFRLREWEHLKIIPGLLPVGKRNVVYTVESIEAVKQIDKEGIELK